MNYRAIEIQNISGQDQRQTEICDLISGLYESDINLIEEEIECLCETDGSIQFFVGLLARVALIGVLDTLISRKLIEDDEGET